jgi:hypothetical protein
MAQIQTAHAKPGNRETKCGHPTLFGFISLIISTGEPVRFPLNIHVACTAMILHRTDLFWRISLTTNLRTSIRGFRTSSRRLQLAVCLLRGTASIGDGSDEVAHGLFESWTIEIRNGFVRAMVEVTMNSGLTVLGTHLSLKLVLATKQE